MIVSLAPADLELRQLQPQLAHLASMGFDDDECQRALRATDGDVERAVERLLGGR